jgi:polyhydroxybutyrate depolymerase
MMRPLFLSAVIVAFVAATSLAAEPPLTRQWQVDGQTREALVFLPANTSDEASPVVFAFHGHGGNTRNVARSMHFQTVWPEAIVVYMQGLNTPGRLTDPEGKKPGWQSSGGDQDDRDLKFFDAVLASLKADYKVDTSRIYATGHSNGGGFTYLLWDQRGDVFAAVAPSASAARNRTSNLRPKPAMHLAGDNDPLVKFPWQEATMRHLQEVNGCESVGETWQTPAKMKGTIYPSKTNTPFVSVIHQQGHKYPAEAPELIVRFFKEHSKTE